MRPVRHPTRILALVLLGTLTSCRDTTGPPVATTIALSSTSLTFASLDEVQPLIATVLDQGGATLMGATVTWMSSATSVATVSPAGVVTAVANGAATITATSGSATGSASVTVQQVAASVSVAPDALVLAGPGDTATVAATVLDAGGSEIAAPALTWSSGDDAVATVDAAGLVTAVATGAVTVSAAAPTAGAPAVDDVALTVEDGVLATPAGGQLTLAGGAAGLLLAAGAVSERVFVTAEPATGLPAAPAAIAGTAFDFGPDGLAFAQPVTLTIAYDPADVAPAPESELRIHELVGGVWVPRPGGSVDTGAHEASAAIDGFSVYAVVQRLAVATASLPDGAEGVAYGGVPLDATGGDGSYAWALAAGSDPLPQGLGLAADGTVSGTPTTAGTSTFTVEVSSAGGTAQRALSITVHGALAITTAALPDAIEGVAYGPEALVATGGDGSYAWALAAGSDPLPDGLGLTAAGVLSGTPTTPGTSSVTVEVASGDGQSAQRTLSLAVNATLAVSTTSLADGVEGVDYGTASLVATGGDGSYAWALAAGSGPLPDGLALGANGDVTGTPTTAGASGFTVEVTSGDGQTATRALSITIQAAGADRLAITTEPSTVATSAVAFPQQPAVQLRDAGGGDIGTAGVVVTAALASGSGALGGTTTATTDGGGLATFADLAITGEGAHTLAFTATAFTSTTSATITVTDVTPLSDGVPLTGLSGLEGEAAYFVFTVPPSTTQLELAMSGGTGDADMHVREGALPTLVDYDCRPFLVGDETCVFQSPAAGDWYVLLNAFTDYSGVTLTATTGCTLNSPDDADGDRLPDCVETNTGVFVSALDTGTDPNDPDTDGDAIDDGDEVLGTVDGLDLPGFGVSPLVPTVLIEYDWFDDNGHSHRPTAAQLALVTASFAAQGIEIIHDYGQGPAPFTGGNFIDDPDGNVDALGGEYYGYKAANFDANRNGYFHYNLHPHQYAGGNSSGLAQINGDDFITATLTFYGDDLAVAGTIQHELGHNLGLLHGGFENRNRKPNYNSVMNYNYQFRGIDDDCTPISDGVLSYSSGVNPTLDENDLDETLGICGGAPGWDWNEDGDALDQGVVADINKYWNPPDPSGDGSFDVLADYDDWSNISYNGIGDFDGAVPDGMRALVACPPPPPWLLNRE